MLKSVNTLLYISILVSIISASNLNAQVVTTNLNPTIRDKTDLHIGFNRRSDPGTWWTDNSFIDLVLEMNPDVVRYPAGTQANYWDWTTGKFLDNTDKNWNNKEVLKIPEFIAALPNRTKIVYVVNMARPTPATGVSVTASEAILKSQSTLDAKIENMIDALDEFVAEGKEPFAVELGNEFFFGNVESGIFEIVESGGFFHSGWDTVNNQAFQSADKKDATVINAKFYLDHCKDIVAGIKAEYPNMKFALTTTKSGNGNSTRERWNDTVFDELENNTDYITLKNDVYAITQHHYLNDNYGVQTVISDIASAKISIAEGIEYPIDKQADYDMVPNDYKIWYTEYGEVKQIADETWASGVRYAALVHSWMSLGDKVDQLDYHYISDNTVVKTGSPMKLAPIGIAAKLVSLATADMTEMQEINFTTNPISVNNVKSLYGYKFKNTEKETLLIFNTSDNNFSQVQFSNLATYNGQPIMTQYYSNAPHVSGVFEGNPNVISNITNVNTTLSVSNFSIVVVEIPNGSLSTDEFLISNLSVFPNPVKNFLNIESDDTLKSVSVYNIGGAEVYNNEKPSNSKINLSTLSAGMYVLKIETIKGLEFKKIIKE